MSTHLDQTAARELGRAAVRHQITAEVYRALERLGADSALLSIVGSWGDTMGDADVLALLRDYNRGT